MHGFTPTEYAQKATGIFFDFLGSACHYDSLWRLYPVAFQVQHIMILTSLVGEVELYKTLTRKGF